MDDFAVPNIQPTGVPKALKGTTIPFPWGEIGPVERLLEQYRGQVAAIILEPMRYDMPPPGYLEKLREIATREEVVLIFDEVITGFRLGPGGAQEYFGVIPDMTCLGKIVGGGLPVGAYGGKKEIMQEVSPLSLIHI